MPIPDKIPAFRRLRGYAFDPSLSLRSDTAFINNIVYNVPWETKLDPGPVGEYLEVVDYDPTTKKHYEPVVLNNKNLLAQDGLQPSEVNPQFHQQMVYAVAMTTITNFETALGRKVIWAPRRLADRDKYAEYVARLRVYPHALRDTNAYYSPQKKALLFGYFEARPANNTLHMPGSFVFTCLSHDIIAHEVTHAILDGMYPAYSEASNPDVLAFHEAFADIVALFQHFTFPEVLKHQVAKTRGDLASQNLLGELAQEFGSAIGSYGSLRDAIGEIDPVTKTWKAKEPRGDEYNTVMEPHQRGSTLVSAVFEAFLSIYKGRIKDLLRMATGGTGVLPQGELHPDLVNRLASEASKAAKHVLNMCIRALDYCPPVDITFGDYLRAIITADRALVNNDSLDYRLAFIEAFRRRGIYPQGLKTFSVDSLELMNGNGLAGNGKDDPIQILTQFFRKYASDISYEQDREKIFRISRKYITGENGLHSRLSEKFLGNGKFQMLTGLVFNTNWKDFGVRTSTKKYLGGEGPSYQIQNLRLVSRVGPENNLLNQVVFSLVQRSGIVMEAGEFKEHYHLGEPLPEGNAGATEDGLPIQDRFVLYGGCTMIFDLNTQELKYVVCKPLLNIDKLKKTGEVEIDRERIRQQYNYQREEGLMHLSEYNRYFGSGLHHPLNEPFCFLHH
ncbi:hypothetical protein [Chitinophaga barathri]|uniref:Peptidase M4 n=1 Tax=Chitinophaga barathri TaxID=1647451 RepID=A0A3N4MEC5_9BACT|nr:hypothetical protein [Chitinophaga barathri]RPD42141.1 hypothetical protein EG028_08345 [Chitinophaga barathri]